MDKFISITLNGVTDTHVGRFAIIAAIPTGDGEWFITGESVQTGEFATWRGIPGNWYWGHYFSNLGISTNPLMAALNDMNSRFRGI